VRMRSSAGLSVIVYIIDSSLVRVKDVLIANQRR